MGRRRGASNQVSGVEHSVADDVGRMTFIGYGQQQPVDTGVRSPHQACRAKDATFVFRYVGPTRETKMGELRGGYIPGDLPPDEQAEANRLLFEHLMGPDQPKTPRTPPDQPTPPKKRE